MRANFTFSWWCCYIFLHHFSHFVVDDDAVEGPALVSSGHLLPHGRDEALRVEEAGHPEAVGSTLKHPATELSVSLQQLSVPKTNRGRVPRHLHINKYDIEQSPIFDYNFFILFSKLLVL